MTALRHLAAQLPLAEALRQHLLPAVLTRPAEARHPAALLHPAEVRHPAALLRPAEVRHPVVLLHPVEVPRLAVLTRPAEVLRLRLAALLRPVAHLPQVVDVVAAEVSSGLAS